MKHLSDKKDVMLAEDDSDDALFFELAMDELDIPYKLRIATNGSMLFVMLKDDLPYILFLDIELPGKDGMSCITEIRKNSEYDKLPVIMYSAHTFEKYREESFRKGANFYMTKANSIKEIVEQLSKVFSIDWSKNVVYPSYDQFFLS